MQLGFFLLRLTIADVSLADAARLVSVAMSAWGSDISVHVMAASLK